MSNQIFISKPFLSKNIICLLVCVLLFAKHGYAQSLDQLSVKKGMSVSGSLNASSTVYTAQGIAARRGPFAWYLNGNINLILFGYSMPFSFSYSNQSAAYSQPFNQFKFAPSYKWARAYFGTTSMAFSNYTLAGHLFNGAGIELSPGKWRVGAMYGTLLKAVPFDIINPESYSNAAYERKGYGVKLGYEDKGNSYGIAVFRAKDNAGSIPFIPDDATITPQENVAVAATVKQNIAQRIFAEAEYSVSLLNRDTRSLNVPGTVGQSPSGLIQSNATAYFDAIQAGLGYRGKTYTVQLRYERVAPGYTTLGAYSIVNDMRNITIAPTIQLFKSRVNLAANIGMQKNNLDNSKLSSAQRWVSNISANIVPNEHWAFTGSYSNFSNYTRIRPQADPYFNNPLDTLNFYQVNNTYNSMVMYRRGDKNKQHSITLNVSYQYASDKSSVQDTIPHLSKFFTAVAGYSYSMVPQALALTGSVNYYQTNASGINTSFVGPTINIAKQYFEKTLRTGLTATYNRTKAITQDAGLSSSSTSSVFNTTFNITYTPKAKNDATAAKTAAPQAGKKIPVTSGRHNIGCMLMYLRRGASANQPGYEEITATMNYSYTF